MSPQVSQLPLTVAIDGPSGSGKSSVSRAVAAELGLTYLDTGAMYRALAWFCQESGLDLDEVALVGEAARDFPLEIGTDPGRVVVAVAGTDITEAIRSTEISTMVSKVATNLDVRAHLRQRQRDLISAARAAGPGIVVEGRDITTVVAPDAECRILLTASEEARLARRAREVHASDDAAALAATRDQVLRRDADDSTVSAFFEPADGVVGIDSSALTFDQTVAAVLAVVTDDRAGYHADAPAQEDAPR